MTHFKRSFLFQSTPLIRGATCDGSTSAMISSLFQSTPLIRGATSGTRRFVMDSNISIHAPHTRGDRVRRHGALRLHDFNPRPSYEGRLPQDAVPAMSIDFNPRPSYEGRRIPEHEIRAAVYFNPRPSYEGRLGLGNNMTTTESFQSTPLIRGATTTRAARHQQGVISIHAPHTRGDRSLRSASP